jgi:hypothetical protein
MKELRITPGEWSVFYGTNGTVVLNEDDEMIVSARNAISGPSEQNANARLIAAAPDLLEALQDALHAYDKHGEHSEWDFARAAISKALGEE